MYSLDHRQSLGAKAYERIREAIITLVVKPGQMVYEAELGEQFGMSRTPIREGIRMLMVEELVEVLPQRGMRVALISEAKVEDIRFVRESLEVSAFRQVAHIWSGDSACRTLEQRVKELLQQQAKAADEGSAERFLALDEKFHEVILQHTGNHTLVNVVGQMRSHLNRVRMLSLRVHPHAPDIIAEHARLFEAVSSGQEDVTIDILTYHLRRLRQDIGDLKGQFGEYFSAD